MSDDDAYICLQCDNCSNMVLLTETEYGKLEEDEEEILCPIC